MPSTLQEFLDRAEKECDGTGKKKRKRKRKGKMDEAKRKEIRTHTIEIKLVDFSSDKDEPAYDVETWIDGKPVMGGGKKQVFSVTGSKDKARQSALSRIGDMLKQFKKIGEE